MAATTSHQDARAVLIVAGAPGEAGSRALSAFPSLAQRSGIEPADLLQGPIGRLVDGEADAEDVE
jgi:hypothetical protein